MAFLQSINHIFTFLLQQMLHMMARRKAALSLAATKWNSDELFQPILPTKLVDTKKIQTEPIEVEKNELKALPIALSAHNWTWKDEQLRGEERRRKRFFHETLSDRAV